MFRFFTVYGPWGRPDLALFKFVDAILHDRPVELYNHGKLHRDFTYIDDLVGAIRALLEIVPAPASEGAPSCDSYDSASPFAPYRIVNIGNARKVRLLDFVDEIERAVGKTARRIYAGPQSGDVPATWADTTLLQSLAGSPQSTDLSVGIRNFVDWFRAYYEIEADVPRASRPKAGPTRADQAQTPLARAD